MRGEHNDSPPMRGQRWFDLSYRLRVRQCFLVARMSVRLRLIHFNYSLKLGLWNGLNWIVINGTQLDIIGQQRFKLHESRVIIYCYLFILTRGNGKENGIHNSPYSENNSRVEMEEDDDYCYSLISREIGPENRSARESHFHVH